VSIGTGTGPRTGIDKGPLRRFKLVEVLRGTWPADIPVKQSTKFAPPTKLKTAKTIGLTVPPLLLVRADEAIQ
jgi:hypothetical protein